MVTLSVPGALSFFDHFTASSTSQGSIFEAGLVRRGLAHLDLTSKASHETRVFLMIRSLSIVKEPFSSSTLVNWRISLLSFFLVILKPFHCWNIS